MVDEQFVANMCIVTFSGVVNKNYQVYQTRRNAMKVESVSETSVNCNHLIRLSASEGFFETKTRFSSSASFPIHHLRSSVL